MRLSPGRARRSTALRSRLHAINSAARSRRSNALPSASCANSAPRLPIRGGISSKDKEEGIALQRFQGASLKDKLRRGCSNPWRRILNRRRSQQTSCPEALDDRRRKGNPDYRWIGLADVVRGAPG